MAKLNLFKKYRGKVLINVQNKSFDCVAKILEYHDSGLKVEVKKYLHGDWNKKEQFYHTREIIRITPIGRSMKTLEVLFGQSGLHKSK